MVRISVCTEKQKSLFHCAVDVFRFRYLIDFENSLNDRIHNITNWHQQDEEKSIYNMNVIQELRSCVAGNRMVLVQKLSSDLLTACT